MRQVKSLLLAGLASAFVIAPASATEDSQMCSLYSNMGGAMVDFMLPLTMQQFVDMMRGDDPQLMMKMTSSLMSGLTTQDMMAIGSMSQSDAELMGEAAGQISVELLMSAQADSSDDVRNLMNSNCMAIGPKNIIANQRAARAMTNANMGK